MDFTYPCTTCIVNACCTVCCIKHFKYINKIVDVFPTKMTLEQIEAYYKSTPDEVKKTVSNFIKYNKHYSFPIDWKSNVPRYVKII